jgi:hypothetical protein
MINDQIYGIGTRILDFFIKKAMLIRIIKLIFLITKLHSKGFERSIGSIV